MATVIKPKFKRVFTCPSCGYTAWELVSEQEDCPVITEIECLGCGQVIEFEDDE